MQGLRILLKQWIFFWDHLEKIWEKVKEILESEPFISAEDLYNHLFWYVTRDFVPRITEITEIVQDRADDWIQKIGRELAIFPDEIEKFSKK